MKQLTTTKAIENYKTACEEIAKIFTKKYFKEHVYGKDTYWVCDEPGGVYCIGDWYFWNIDRMLEALELKATYKKLIDFYDMECEIAADGKNMPYNFKNYIKYGKQLCQ